MIEITLRLNSVYQLIYSIFCVHRSTDRQTTIPLFCCINWGCSCKKVFLCTPTPQIKTKLYKSVWQLYRFHLVSFFRRRGPSWNIHAHTYKLGRPHIEGPCIAHDVDEHYITRNISPPTLSESQKFETLSKCKREPYTTCNRYTKFTRQQPPYDQAILSLGNDASSENSLILITFMRGFSFARCRSAAVL